MKTYGGIDAWIHVFLTSVLVGGEWTASHTGRFIPGKRSPGTHWIGGLVSLRTGLENVKRRQILLLPALELRPLGLPVCRQSLYWLGYQGLYYNHHHRFCSLDIHRRPQYPGCTASDHRMIDKLWVANIPELSTYVGISQTRSRIFIKFGMNYMPPGTIPGFSNLTIESPMVTIYVYITYLSTSELRILPTQCICVFRMVLTINSGCFPKQH
jgi:hypothetical protein